MIVLNSNEPPIGKNNDLHRRKQKHRSQICFCYMDGTVPHLLKSKISSFYLFSVTVQAGLCQTSSGTQIVSFHTHRLISF